MGYSHGRKWEYGEIQNEIMKMVRETGIERMPSKSEIEKYFGDCSLSNKISKSGGFYYLAETLGLPIKKSETNLGKKIEKLIRNKLIELGFDAETTGVRSPYDLIVNRRVKIDVKASRIITSGTSPYYTFNLNKKDPSCDFYIAVTLDEMDKEKDIYVIPSTVLSGKCQLSIGIRNTIYQKYLDRWELITQLDEAFRNLEAI